MQTVALLVGACQIQSAQNIYTVYNPVGINSDAHFLPFSAAKLNSTFQSLCFSHVGLLNRKKRMAFISMGLKNEWPNITAMTVFLCG